MTPERLFWPIFRNAWAHPRFRETARSAQIDMRLYKTKPGFDVICRRLSSATHFMLALAAQARNLPSLPKAPKATTVAFMGSKDAHDGLRGNPVDGRDAISFRDVCNTHRPWHSALLSRKEYPRHQ